MKKKFYFATLVIALLTFTGCANDEYVGDQQNLGEQNGAIAFSTKSENTVRAGKIDGEEAAKRLNKQFWVYGTKKVTVDGTAKDQLVFNNYQVVYDKNSKSPSNTKGWEYVGIEGTNQTIKYWDYSASQYDFEAYSYKNGTGTTVEKLTEDREYDRNLKKDDYQVKVDGAPEHLYFAQKETKTKPTPAGTKYEVVKLTFKSVLSKIRVGFYETIPGYSVKITKFYGPNGDGTGWANEDDGYNFVAWCPNKKIDGNMSFVVRYGTENNNATPAITKVKKDNDYQDISTAGSPGGYTLNPTLTLGGECLNKTIGTQSSKVTWDQYEVNDGPSKYTYVIPQDNDKLYEDPKIVQPMRIKVDYTLKSEDSEETIEVKGATAIVPAEYLRWKANTAYSYVFKISDQTNGTTGDPSTDPAGLYPITFDAVVEDMAEYKDHLTTVSDLSITATQETQFDEADKAVFKTGQDMDIKVKVMYNNVDITSRVHSSSGGDSFVAVFYTSYDTNKSLEEYFNGKITEHTYENSVNPDYIKLPQKDNAGYWIVKVTIREYTGGNTKDITKYAVLKVGTDTQSTPEGGSQGQ